MKIALHCVGKIRDSDPENIIIKDYLKRLGWVTTINEYATKTSAFDPEKQILSESELMLNKFGDSCIVALDSRGVMLDSDGFAKFFSKQQISGISKISFCIGGAYGHHKKLIDRADFILSLGRMTLPHKLARVVLVEQIYRAETIINKHPYHK